MFVKEIEAKILVFRTYFFSLRSFHTSRSECLKVVLFTAPLYPLYYISMKLSPNVGGSSKHTDNFADEMPVKISS